MLSALQRQLQQPQASPVVHRSSISAQSEDTVAEVSPDSDEFVLELMTQCEMKLQLLQEELQGKDLAAIKKEMEEEEVRRSSRNCQPASQCFWVLGWDKMSKLICNLHIWSS